MVRCSGLALLIALPLAGQASGFAPLSTILYSSPRAVSGERFAASGPQFAAVYRDSDVRLSVHGANVRLWFPGANPAVRVRAVGRQPGTVSFLKGPRSTWATGLHTYSALVYRNLYPGIDLFWEAHGAGIKTEFRIAPGTDPSAIRMAYEGIVGAHVDSTGALALETGGGNIRDEPPRVWSESAGTRRPVGAKYVIGRQGVVGFAVDAYDRRATLVIDPVLSYSTLLGGSGHDSASAVAVDGSGSAYIAGWTESSDFPVTGGLSQGGSVDMFVAKFTAANALAYCTFIGGSGDDRATGIAVDASGNAVVAGYTSSSDMPLVKPVQALRRGGSDVYVAKLNASGTALLLGTYVGGSKNDTAAGVALDGTGNVYVAGSTSSTDFPAVNPYQSVNRGAQNAFVFKLNPAGPALAYSTYLGGSGSDGANSIAVDGAGAAYVTGMTTSYNFPMMAAIQSTNRGQETAFVAKLKSSGNALAYSTYLGGSGGAMATPEFGSAIAVDSSGAAYVAGVTSSQDFPVVNGYQASYSGSTDAFATKLNATGSAILYSTFLGGTGRDWANGIALDGSGAVYVCGYTASWDFPSLQAVQSSNGGMYDAFVAELDGAGSGVFSTYFGGGGNDSADAIAVDASKNILVAGHTLSSNFPLLNPLNIANAGGYAGFFLKLGGGSSTCAYSVLPNPASVAASGGPLALSMNAAAGCAWSATSNATWLHAVVASGSGNGSISLTADKNASGTARSASLAVAGQSVAVNQAGNVPLLTITKTHSGDFQTGQQNATFQITVSNATGAAVTSGTVTVTESPGAGLALSSLSGPGWSCNGNTCSRADALAAGASYAAITATLVVASNAGAEVINQAAVSGGGSTAAAASDMATVSTPGGSTALGFFPMTPCRMVDTRASQGNTGALGPPSLAAWSGRNFPLLSSACGVPATAAAYSLNFTIVPPGALDFLSAWPSGSAFPGVSTLNSPAGKTLANAAIVPAGSGGGVTVVAGEATDVIIDNNGYFAPPNGHEMAFYAVAPCRVVDTRSSQNKTGAFGPPSLAGYAGRDFPIVASNCGIPASAQAYSLNFTVVPAGPLDFLSAWPASQPFPGVSTLNSPAGEALANAAIVPAGTNGAITVVAGNPTDLIIDVNGYFGPAGGVGALHFYAVTPCRVADTRASQGKTGAFGPPSLAPYSGRDFPIASGGCGIPSSAQAYSLNITVVPQGALDFVSLWPAGQPFPGVSTLNSAKGAIIANAAIVPAGAGGAVTVVAGNPTDLIIDINGYFAP